MISRYEYKDGQRAMIAIFPDEDIVVTTDENDVALIGGPKGALRGLYAVLEELFKGVED